MATSAIPGILSAALAASPLAGDPRFEKDFDFLAKTVRLEYAALKSKDIDWDAICKRFEPRFAKCESEIEHVKNVMEILATLRDSHTGVTETRVDRKELPGKFDGLYGGGLWFGWDGGKFVVRGIMAGHALGSTVPIGSVLVCAGGEPAWYAMERERRRAARFAGASSDHSFWASLSNRLLPFGEKRDVEAQFLDPTGKTRKVTVPRWGPGGQSFDFVGLFLPEGLEGKDAASSAIVRTEWSKNVGFLKITGGMDAATVSAFHAAFDALKGMDALVLDCRSMGGGGDPFAWEMAGRLYSKGVPYGSRRLEPSGSWQFDGPVVMLQDETEVSSAETFTWAVSETGRVVSVGRPTGGWGIIPRGFELPSGIAKFRLGVNDRPTPLKNVHTEGVGWPPDVLIPFGPEMCLAGEKKWAPLVNEKYPDPVLAVATEILRVLHAGVPADEARDAFHGLAEGEAAAFLAFAKKAAAKAKGFEGDRLAKLFKDDLEAEIAQERALLDLQDEMPPDALGALRRAPRLVARAKALGLAKDAAALEKAVKAAKSEAAAQEALFAALDADFALSDKAAKAFLGKHGATKTGRFVKRLGEK